MKSGHPWDIVYLLHGVLVGGLCAPLLKWIMVRIVYHYWQSLELSVQGTLASMEYNLSIIDIKWKLTLRISRAIQHHSAMQVVSVAFFTALLQTVVQSLQRLCGDKVKLNALRTRKCHVLIDGIKLMFWFMFWFMVFFGQIVEVDRVLYQHQTIKHQTIKQCLAK